MRLWEAIAAHSEIFFNKWLVPFMLGIFGGVVAVCVEILKEPISLARAIALITMACFIGIVASMIAVEYGLSRNGQLIACALTSVTSHNIIKLLMELTSNPEKAFKLYDKFRGRK